MKRISSILFSLAVVFTASFSASAQTATPTPPTVPRTVIKSDTGIAPVIPAMFEPIVTGGLLDALLVTGKPVSATLESETVQTLPDGTSSTRRVVTKIYRDASGRTRREQRFYANGETPAPNDAAQSITIFDPVGRWGYTLDPARNAASRYKLPAELPTEALFDNQTPQLTKIFRNAASGGTTAYTLPSPVVQSLGKQTVSGVQADGYKVTFKVPAGALGNAAEIQTVYEAWVSLDLKMLLRCTVTSPLSGSHKLVTTSLSQTAPASTLFTVPAGYTINQMGVTIPNATPPPVQ